ncbi:MAG: class II aldolase/adducin family protein [Gammaproteobacteria bacterium]
MSEDEWRARVDLAACYRLAAHHGMSDLTATHISARVPGESGVLLLNGRGLFFDEITASSLIKARFDGTVITESPYALNPAGLNIHAAVLEARPDVTCVLHSHTRAGLAVAAMSQGLLPLSQHALRFYERIGYHEYEGMADDPTERSRLAADLGPHSALILRNHGLLVAGRSTPETFRLMHLLELACQAQIDVLAAGMKPHFPSEAVCERTARQFDAFGSMGGRDWPGHLRRLDRLDPSYRL